MLSLPGSVKVYVATQPTDMRKGFDKLAGLARSEVRRDPRSGHLFVFFNRNRDRVKVLFWDRTGFAVLYKRLERGRFRLPIVPEDTTAIQISAGDLHLILEGIDLGRGVRRARWSEPRSPRRGS